MVRYLTQETDRAAELEDWVQGLAEEFSNSLVVAELRPDRTTRKRVSLDFRTPFESGGEEHFNGSVSMYIDFDKEEPDFLTDADKNLWYPKVMEIAGESYGLSAAGGMILTRDSWPALEHHLYRFSIPFEEDSEDKLYILTPQKGEVMRKGFERLQRYIDFYVSAVRGYDVVALEHGKSMERFLSNLESISEQV